MPAVRERAWWGWSMGRAWWRRRVCAEKRGRCGRQTRAMVLLVEAGWYVEVKASGDLAPVRA